MDDGETNDATERTRVGVVAPETDAARIVEAVADAGGIAETGSVEVAAGSDAVVAVGDGALSALAVHGVSIPVLPVATTLEAFTTPEAVRDAVERIVAGADETRELPVVRVETPRETDHAVFDVALTTAEPATISEFTVARPDAVTGSERADGQVARFRADGVVVATPAGSRGYARAAGGPVVVRGSNAATVVPVAPFATDPDHWVVPLSGLTITVERDVDVAVTVDGRSLSTVRPGTTIRLTPDGVLGVVSPVSRARK